jgi:hypothetical protein
MLKKNAVSSATANSIRSLPARWTNRWTVRAIKGAHTQKKRDGQGRKNGAGCPHKKGSVIKNFGAKQEKILLSLFLNKYLV